MAIKKIVRTERRSDALSKERIVEAAIQILDAEGEGGLTFRNLARHLSTGSGAIYHHVASKEELLAATTEEVIAAVMEALRGVTKPRAAILRLAVGVFDAIDAHPWVGAQLSRAPWQSAMVHIFEGIGTKLQALGVAERVQFDAASALVNYMLGVAGQNAANARLHIQGTDRTTFLSAVAAQWAQLDPAAYPFVRQMAMKLPKHDDRAQFLVGVEFILSGITAGQ